MAAESSPPISDDQIQRLGQLEKTYNDIYPAIRIYLYFGLICTVIIFAAMVPILRNIKDPATIYLVFVLIFAVGWSIFFVVPWLRVIFNHNQRLHLFAGGFVFLCRKGIWQVVCWDEITHVLRLVAGNQDKVIIMHGCVYPPSRVVEVLCADGRKLTISNYLAGSREIADVLVERSGSLVRQKCLTEIEGGNSASFGSFQVSESCLSYKSRSLPWNQIQAIAVPDNTLTIDKKGFSLRSWCRVATKCIPNYEVFMELVSMFRERSEE